MKKIYFLTFIVLKSISISAQLYTPGAGVTDIDGNTYQTIVINGQEWMAENLKTSKYADGSQIQSEPLFLWNSTNYGTWCYYGEDSLNNVNYGKLYNWHSVSDQRNVCPTGWKVPTQSDWEDLSFYLGGPFNLDQSIYPGNPGNSISGGKMKSLGNLQDGTGLWESPNLNATNESGFTAHPAGLLYVSSAGNTLFDQEGNWATFWSSSNYSDNLSIKYSLWFDYGYFQKETERKKSEKNHH